MRVVGQARKGLCNKDIAAALNITERCVKAHFTSIYSKFGIENPMDKKRVTLHKIIGFE